MLFNPDKIIKARKGLHRHEFIKIKEIKAIFGLPKKPIGLSIKFILISVELTMPLLLLNMSFQITTITTVGIMNESITQLVAILRPLNFLFRVNAIRNAKNVCAKALPITHNKLLFKADQNFEELSILI